MTVDYTREGKVAVFVLNRPRSMNSLDMASLNDLHESLKDFHDNPDLNVGIITGAGDEAFCTGIDIRDMLYSINKFQDYSRPLPITLMQGLDTAKPVIAAINGLVLGGGLEIVHSCDIRIASENAVFGTPQAALGAVPAWGGTQRQLRSIPWCQAAEMLLKGKTIDAHEAYRMGLVNRVVAKDELAATAREWAKVLCSTNLLGLRNSKVSGGKGPGFSRDNGLAFEDSLEAYMEGTEELFQGFKTFSKRKKPFYQAR